jgi:hypothetical protein
VVVEVGSACPSGCAVLRWIAVPDASAWLVVSAEPSATEVVVSDTVANWVAGRVVKALSRLVLSPPTPTAGTEPSSVPLPVRVVRGSELELISMGTTLFARVVESVEIAARVADSIVVCVNRLNRLVLTVPPTPTAGTDPSSVPPPDCVAKGFRADVDVVATAAFAGSVSDCLFQGDLGDWVRPLTTYRLGG